MRVCGTCKYGVKNQQPPGMPDEDFLKDNGGACRIDPPVAHLIPMPQRGGMGVQNLTVWPSIDLKTSWCGRYDAKEMEA